MVTALDVLDYLTLDEENEFYSECSRVLRKGGYVISSHSNELFDLFTFNRYTVEFFKKHYSLDITGLIHNPDKPARSMANIRGNPLSHNQKVARYGFKLDKIDFLMQHNCPPLLDDNFDPDNHAARTYPDTRLENLTDRWKLNFNCSVFCAAIQKI